MLHKLFENRTIYSLDDPVKKYIPEFSVKNPFNNEQITLRYEFINIIAEFIN